MPVIEATADCPNECSQVRNCCTRKRRQSLRDDIQIPMRAVVCAKLHTAIRVRITYRRSPTQLSYSINRH
jgi:hypothetical protein